MTGEQPVYSTHSLQSIWEGVGQGAHREGGSPGNPSGCRGYWCFIFSRWHCVYWDQQKESLHGKLNCFLRKHGAYENARYLFFSLSNMITQILFSIHVSTLFGAQGIFWFIILTQTQGAGGAEGHCMRDTVGIKINHSECSPTLSPKPVLHLCPGLPPCALHSSYPTPETLAPRSLPNTQESSHLLRQDNPRSFLLIGGPVE